MLKVKDTLNIEGLPTSLKQQLEKLDPEWIVLSILGDPKYAGPNNKHCQSLSILVDAVHHGADSVDQTKLKQASDYLLAKITEPWYAPLYFCLLVTALEDMKDYVLKLERLNQELVDANQLKEKEKAENDQSKK